MQVNILADAGIGGTFLSWSIYYLSGQTEYLDIREKITKPVIDNPLTAINAHGFRANQLQSLDLISSLSTNTKNDELDVIYHHVFNRTFTNEQRQWAVDHLLQMTNKNIFYANSNIRFINRIGSQNNYIQNIIDFYFKESFEEMSAIVDMSKPWNIREFLASKLDVFDEKTFSIKNFIPLYNKNVYYIEADHSWNALDDIMPDLLSWLNLSLDENRYEKWLLVFYEWRKLTRSSFKLHWYFDEIIAAILQNNYINLERFDLGILQESFILGYLMRTYNLNIKLCGIERFIDTQQIHSLLEPNSIILDTKYFT